MSVVKLEREQIRKGDVAEQEYHMPGEWQKDTNA